jgi:hypothetical protein
LVSIARDPEQPAAARVGASRVLVAQFNDFRSSAPSAERLAYMEKPAGEGVEEDTE